MNIRIISTGLGLVGVAGFFVGNFILVAVGGIASVIGIFVLTLKDESISQGTIMLYVVLGIFYATYVGIPNNMGVFIGLCFESTISGIIGFSVLGIDFFSKGTRKNK